MPGLEVSEGDLSDRGGQGRARHGTRVARDAARYAAAGASLLALTAAALTEPALPAPARRRLAQIADQADRLAEMSHGCVNAYGREAPTEVEEPGDGYADVMRVVVDVLGNAERAAGPIGTVTVEIRWRKDGVLAVEDNGPGFGKIPSRAGLGWSAVAGTLVEHGGRMQCGSGAPQSMAFVI